MAIAEMRKVLLVGEKTSREKVVEELRQAGVFQPVPLEKKNGSHFFKPLQVDTNSLEDDLGKIRKAIDFLSRFEEKKFDLGLFPTKVIVNSRNYLKWTQNSEWEKICQRCSHIEQQIEQTKEMTSSLQDEYQNLLPWRKVDFPLGNLNKLKYLDYQLAAVPSEAKGKLQNLVKKESCYVWIVEEVARKAHVLLVFVKEARPKVAKILQEVEADKISLPENIAPSVRLREIREEQNQLQKKKEKAVQGAKKFASQKVKLMTMYDHLQTLLNEKKTHSQAGITKYTFCLEGWIKKEDIDLLKSTLKNFPQVEAVVKKPQKKELSQAPVALSNSKIMKPFEFVTELYGLPRYIELDPTPFLGPFFAFFLALCLTDGGYGIILAVLSFLIPRKIQVGEGGKKLFSILFISGLITILVGAVTGGIFGVQLQNLPSFLSPLKKLALINPMRQPMIFLVIVLFIGIIHLLLGIVIETVDNLRRKKIAAAFLDQFSWLVLIIGLLLTAAPFGKNFISPQTGQGGGIPLALSPSQIFALWKGMPPYSQVGSTLAAGAAIVLFVFAGRKSKNIGIRLGKGAYEIYGIIQVFADVLSYSRLLALGLATSVIATVVNTIAGMAGGIPLLGPVALVVILILGHIGNLLINALSGFIHTARLQFVEFFTKFYEGGGKRFEPLKTENQYTMIQKEG